MGLCLHNGTVEVSEDQVREVKTPEPTSSWMPVPHAFALDRVKSEISAMGLRVTQEAHGLWNEGARYFGVLEVVNGHNQPDYGLVLGIRNSHDQSFSLSLGIGSHVFVCDNLAFSSEVVIKTRHTQRVLSRIPSLISRAVAQLVEQRQRQHERIEAYKNTSLDDLHCHDLMVRGIRDKVIAPSAVSKVMREWYEPSHADFQPRTVWSAFNAFTETLKSSNPLDLPRRSRTLHGLCDGICGLALN